ncbi:19596_t:CDS:2, partial [Racocetra fulgida]
ENQAKEQELVEELQHQIDALRIRIPISQFTDEDFVQGATEIEQEEEEEVEIIEPTLTAKEKLAILRDALKIVTEM